MEHPGRQPAAASIKATDPSCSASVYTLVVTA
jgi:hypothetical protein